MRVSRALSVLTASAVAAGILIAVASPASAAAGCRVDYAVNQWPGGFTADVTVHNLGAPIDGWTLAWDFTAGQVISQGWNGVFARAGQRVTVTNASWNARIATNATVSLGFLASWQGSNPKPASFALNGTVCTGTVVTSAAPTSAGPTSAGPTSAGPTSAGPTSAGPTSARPTSAGPTSAGPTSAGPTSAGPTSGGPSDPPLDNPFLGAAGYLNPDHVARVNAAADAAGGTLGGAMREVARHPTAVWLDTIASITAGRGLRGHLDAALAQQQAAGRPVVVTLVLQNLPNRSCSSRILPGELTVAGDGLQRYKSEYIDPIAAVLADPRYASLRVAVIVEPDSLHHLLYTVQAPACAEVRQSGAYVLGVQYALNKLHPIANVYPYLDASNSGVIGWENNFVPMAQLYASIVSGTAGGMSSVAGFAVNTASYVPVEETVLTDPNQLINGQPVRSARFYDWNPMFDESDLIAALYPRLVSLGFPSSIGFVIDTSRNGWNGNPAIPPQIPTDVDQWVNWARIDRRLDRTNWCNQVGAGLGARPVAAPRPNVDAYLWVKVPGESDGVSDPTLPEARLMDPMCEPGHLGPSGQESGAMRNAPPRGAWFPAAFTGLVERAYPPLIAR
ncbi:glycoside hydrolase family 6 protein [Luedemannella helvata]|uniref:Glucanase n=1 Tax=Luedemannella helvata TaxID=349315 RepID=A0ABP4X3C3_9ACTN